MSAPCRGDSGAAATRRRSAPTGASSRRANSPTRSNRLSYVYGVMLNRKGMRFVDEGEDGELFTYAKFGRAILAEPGAKAWQIFDPRVVHLLEPRYPTSKPITADTLEGTGRAARLRRRDQALEDARRIQCGRARGGRRFRSDQEGRLSSKGWRWRRPTGRSSIAAAVLRLQRHRRHHLHLRRLEGE